MTKRRGPINYSHLAKAQRQPKGTGLATSGPVCVSPPKAEQRIVFKKSGSHPANVVSLPKVAGFYE